jgi:hypothetical protein
MTYEASWSDLAPGETVRDDLFVVLTSYFTPAHAQGNPLYRPLPYYGGVSLGPEGTEVQREAAFLIRLH